MTMLAGPIQRLNERLRGHTRRPLRFLIAGGLNTLLGLALYPVLLWSFETLREHYLVALGISQSVCLIFAFITYRQGVFKSQGQLMSDFFRFSAYYMANYAMNWAALPVLVEIGQVNPIYAQFGFALISVIGSYFWHNHVTFRNQQHD